jgi:hypothetical protein
MRKVNFGKDVRICWLTVIVIMIFTPADIFVTDVKGISSVLCPPCYSWNGYCVPPPPGCICCFGVCCNSNLCETCGDNPVSPCEYLCDPDQCEGCVNGSCTTGVCVLEVKVFDDSGILCACESSYCDPPGQITYIYLCRNDCYGNCHCRVTMGEQLGTSIPICRSQYPWGCISSGDCSFLGWYDIYGEATVSCNCEHD